MKGNLGAVSAVVVIGVLACSVAYGAPSLLGPTGVLLMPNAEVVGSNAVDVGAHFVDVDGLDFAAYKATVGLSERLEVTGSLLSWDNGAEDNDFTAHAKYQLLSRRESGCRVAAGVMDAFEEAFDDAIWYVAVSRTAGGEHLDEKVVRGTVGLAVAENIGGSGDDAELFTSLEAQVSDHVTVVTEYFSDDFSFGARTTLADRFTVDIASLETAGDRDFLIGGAYHLSW